MAKRPPRKKTINKEEQREVLVEMVEYDEKLGLYNKEKIKEDILMSDIGLGMNEIYCGDTCETMAW